MKKIVIIDDFEDSATTLAEILESPQIHVVGEGHNGKDAYDLYKKLKPDFVILDMNMPKYDGRYAIKKIKSEFPNAKIISITGYENYAFTKQEVVANFLKPFDMNKLISVISNN